MDEQTTCPATVDLAGDLTQSTAIWFPLQTHLPQACVVTDSRDLGWERAERERIQSQLSFGLCSWQMHSCLGSEQVGERRGEPRQLRLFGGVWVCVLGGDVRWVGGRVRRGGSRVRREN